MEFDINLLAVLGAAISAMALGALWYSPVLFGKPWMKLMGITEAQMKAGQKKDMALSYILQFGASLLTAYILAHFIAVWRALAGVMSLADGFELAFFIWLGFMAPVMLGMVLWEGKSWVLYTIVAGYQLAAALLMSGILSSFT